MVGPIKIQMVHVTWPRPFQGWFVICRLAPATINIHVSIKFEVSNSTHYQDMKGDAKYQKRGGLCQLGFTENSAIQ